MSPGPALPPWLERLRLSRYQALRLFFALHYSATALAAIAPASRIDGLWRNVLRWFASDLEGTLEGIERTRLALDLHWLRSPPYSILFLLFVAVTAVELVRNRNPRAAACGLLLASQLLGYSSPGISLAFQIVAYAATGYFLGLVVVPPLFRRLSGREVNGESLAWLTAVSAVGGAYASAAFSKWTVPGFLWADPLRMGVLLHYGRFRFEMGNSPFGPPESLLSWFAGPSLLGSALLWGAMLVEAGALLVAWLGRFVRAFLVAILLLHAGIVLTLGIAWPPLIALLGVLAFPWELGSKEPARPPLPRAGVAAAFLCGLILAATAWCLPRSGPATRVFPFNRFAMYTFPSQPLHLYYFRMKADGQLLPRRLLRDWAQLSPQQVNLLVNARFPPNALAVSVGEFLCRQFSRRRARESVQVWTRVIQADGTRGRLAQQDLPVLDCQQVPGGADSDGAGS